MILHPGHATIRRLRDGEIVDLDDSGIHVRMTDGELTPGDDYVGARNTVNLLTVKYVDYDNHWVMPVEPAYPFDLHECVKVEIVSA